jgi:hypothetical protein
VGVAHHSTSVEKNDERILAVEQVVDLLEDILNISAKFVSKRHGSELPGRKLRVL